MRLEYAIQSVGAKRVVLDTMLELGEHSAAAGFDHHLVKPLDPDQLERLLGECAALLTGSCQALRRTGFDRHLVKPVDRDSSGKTLNGLFDRGVAGKHPMEPDDLEQGHDRRLDVGEPDVAAALEQLEGLHCRYEGAETRAVDKMHVAHVDDQAVVSVVDQLQQCGAKLAGHLKVDPRADGLHYCCAIPLGDINLHNSKAPPSSQPQEARPGRNGMRRLSDCRQAQNIISAHRS